jgi:peptide/nickel transport system substrate-binding protein
LAPNNETTTRVAGSARYREVARWGRERLLKEAGAENLSFELLNRDVDQPYKYVGIWIVDEWSKIGVKVTQKVLPSGPWVAAERAGDFSVVLQANCHSVVNPLIDVQPYLSSSVSKQNYGNYEDLRNRTLRKALQDRSGNKTGDVSVRQAS